jgi:hypothetical protein
MERVMGVTIGDTIRTIHESYGVIFHLGATVNAIGNNTVTLSTGERLNADLLVGIGVRPVLALATQTRLAVDRGVIVDQYLQCGRYLCIRRHRLLAGPQDRPANPCRTLGCRRAAGTSTCAKHAWPQAGVRRHSFLLEPALRTVISHVDRAEQWGLDIDRDLATNDDAVTFWHHGRKLAVATIGRDLDCLRAELAFEEEPTAWQRAFPQNISD